MLRARCGDKAAFAALFERHRTTLRVLCRRALAGADAVDDVEQEAALQALLNLNRLTKPERFGPWICGIGLNLCRRQLRERGRDPLSWESLVGGLRVDEPGDDSTSPGDLAEQREIRDRVRRAVDVLPPGQRAAVLLFYLAGLTHAEVAAQLGIEVGTLKTRLHKARGSLRRELWEFWKEMKSDMSAEQDRLIDVKVEDIRLTRGTGDKDGQHIVILREVAGDRRCNIWIGKAEADNIALILGSVQVPRPQTHALAVNLLTAIGGRLRDVVVTRLVDDVFYAEINLDGPGGTRTVDARPSDAINLALIAGAPIRVTESLLARTHDQLERNRANPPEGWTDPFGQGTQSAREIAAANVASWPRPPEQK